MNIVFGVFIVLHGLVHMLYFGQSARFFELAPGMVWPDGSWAFSKFLGLEANRILASILLVLATVGFVAGGVGILASQSWSRSVIVGSAIFSSLLFILLWDGIAQRLDNKGAIGILINAAILAALLLFHWPNFKF